MPSGNGCRAQMKRDRNAKAAGATAKSQLEINKKAMNIICNVCRQTFLCTAKEGDLRAHFEAKHPKGFSFEQCFPPSA